MNDNKVKILLVAPYFPPHSGGLENYAFNVACGLVQTYGYEVVVVTSNPNGNNQIVEDYFGMKVYRLPIMLQISNTPINPLWYIALKRIIRAEKPDIINSHQPVPFIGDLAAFLAGSTPFVLTYHSGTMRKNKFLLDIIIFLYEWLILPRTARKASKIICVSNFVKNTILQKYACNSIIIHPGVDPAVFKADANVRREDNIILFVVGSKSMHRMKGLYNLIDAIKMLPETQLRIVGEKGDFIDKRIVSVGSKRGKDLVEEMQRASVVVLPSLAVEGFPMVLVEAMACQTPVVGTNIGGIPEVIREGIDGFVVPPNDSKALSLAIAKILTVKELASCMGHSGEAKVRETLTWDISIALTKEAFESCLK